MVHLPFLIVAMVIRVTPENGNKLWLFTEGERTLEVKEACLCLMALSLVKIKQNS